MPQSNTYHEPPEEAFFRPAPEPLPADFSFNDSTPPTDPDFKASGGRFVKGHDPRRHKFTAAECSEGFWAGLASYVEQGGEARNFLRRKMSARGQVFRHTPKARRGLLAA
ncbi:MAG: hypothetical protein M3444_09105 [Acidobacteriota bacterium]|nr:hypothetical protein [Acidobacteriota bacterium]MDQ5837218.1 hypothetical protein [Acidobacteriota bacterium]